MLYKMDRGRRRRRRMSVPTVIIESEDQEDLSSYSL
jgi:hypothetical protein